MKNIYVITAYQYEITRNLVDLLGRDNCLLVVDELSEDWNRFKVALGDIILVSGRFGYYSIDEAIGRIRMFKLLSKYEFDRVHIISQNDLPTHGLLYVDKIAWDNVEYIHVNKDGWISNYMTLSKAAVDYISSQIDGAAVPALINYINLSIKDNVNYPKGAPSELILKYIVSNLNISKNDLRLQVYEGSDLQYGYHSYDLGHRTKKLSPFTLDLTEGTKKLLKSDKFLFARKFDYNSELYNYWYKHMFELLWR